MKNHSRRVVRVFLAQGQAGEEVLLEADDAFHLARVLRLSPGDEVEGFDGRGCRRRGVLTALSPEAGKVLVRQVEHEAPADFPCLVLGLSIFRLELMDLVVQKAVELGGSEVVPLVADYTSLKDPAAAVAKRRERWERIMRESLKQCGRNSVPVLGAPERARAWFAGLGDRPDARLLFHAGGRPMASLFRVERPLTARRFVLAVGPEGGWSEEELNSADAAGFERFSLGPHTLRSETAAIAGLAIVAGCASFFSSPFSAAGL